MYILLIICFLVLISILYLKQKNEHFEDQNVYSDKNVFVNNQQLDIDTINVNRLCIKDEKGVECINKSELFNALELPIFRKHSYCIDDACITKNNLKKIKGDTNIKLKSVTDQSKCVGFSNIEASLSLRTQKKWETDKIGLRVGINDTSHPEYHRISYNSLYEPKGGWVYPAKDGPENRCKKGYGKYDYDNVLKYGCKARHRSSKSVCWESAGRRCHRLRRDRRNTINNLYRSQDKTQVDSDMQNLPKIDLPSMKHVDCNSEGDDSSMNFEINSGKLKSEINGIIGSEISTKKYRNISQHNTHSKLVPVS